MSTKDFVWHKSTTIRLRESFSWAIAKNDSSGKKTTPGVELWLRTLDRHLVHDDGRDGPVIGAGLDLADLLDHVHAFDDDTEDRVLAVEVRRGAERDEELAAVGARSGIGHREDTRAVMPEV